MELGLFPLPLRSNFDVDICGEILHAEPNVMEEGELRSVVARARGADRTAFFDSDSVSGTWTIDAVDGAHHFLRHARHNQETPGRAKDPKKKNNPN